VTAGPEVTVVIPTHNRAHVMQATLRSVLRQRDVDVRVVVVDDGSSDETPEVLGAIRDERVRWHRNERAGGVSNARNIGLGMVATPWVAFSDDDDLWAPDKLARQLASLRAEPGAGWSCVGSVVVDPGGSSDTNDRPRSPISPSTC
jgi:glycosyltransferase involved in cell wall biosynthesis